MVPVKGVTTHTHSVSLMHKNKYEIHAQMDVKWIYVSAYTLSRRVLNAAATNHSEG